jgi:hypothetical protein
MSKRTIFSILTTVILGYLIHSFFFSQSVLANVDELIRKELPRGASKQQVYDFLEARAIRSGAYNAGPDPLIGLPDKERQWRRYVEAWIYKKSYIPFSPSYTIHIYFYFDESQNLDGFKLMKVEKNLIDFP